MSKKKAVQKMKKAPESASSIKSYLISASVVVAFLAVVFFAWFIVGTEEDLNKVTVPHDVRTQIAELDPAKKTPLGSFQVNMNNEWTFPNGKSTSTNAFVSNYIGNTHTVYFTLALDGSEEILYTSPHIPVGGKLENLTIDTELGAGVHTAILTYHLLEADGTEYSTLAVTVKLIIPK